MQDMCACVICGDTPSAFFVDLRLYFRVEAESAEIHFDLVNDDTADGSVGINDTGDTVGRRQCSRIADLTTGLGIKRCLIENDFCGGTLSFDRLGFRTINKDANDPAFGSDGLISQKLRAAFFDKLSVKWRNCSFVSLPALPGTFALFFEFRIEAVHVQSHGLLIGDFFRKIERKS